MSKEPSAPAPRRGLSIGGGVAALFLVGIAAAIYVPVHLKNQLGISSLAMGEIRTIISAEIYFQSQNAGFYERRPECLARPVLCLPGFAGAPALDPNLAERLRTGATRQGYVLELRAGPVPAALPPAASKSSTKSFAVIASPAGPATENHVLCGDDSGALCAFAPGTKDGIVVATPQGGVRCLPDCPVYPGH